MDGTEMWDGDGAHLNVQSNTAALFPGLPLTICKKNTWKFLTTSKRRIHCTALKRERHVDNNHKCFCWIFLMKWNEMKGNENSCFCITHSSNITACYCRPCFHISLKVTKIPSKAGPACCALTLFLCVCAETLQTLEYEVTRSTVA